MNLFHNLYEAKIILKNNAVNSVGTNEEIFKKIIISCIFDITNLRGLSIKYINIIICVHIFNIEFYALMISIFNIR